MKEINDLPGEMLTRIFRPLPPGDLKMVVLVSRWWRLHGEDPSLWKWCRVKVKNRDDINKLSIGRLHQMQEILGRFLVPGVNLEAGDWKAMLEAILILPRLKKLKLRGCFKPTKPIYSQTVQANGQKRAVCSETSKMYKLDEVERSSLHSVDPALLSAALTRLEDVDLGWYELSTHQITSILASINKEDSKLKNISLRGSYLSSMEAVDPTVLATALTRLEDVDLSEAGLTTEQMTCIFTHMQVDTNLKKLILFGNDLSEVEPSILATAVTRLEHADLGVSLTGEQTDCIIEHTWNTDGILQENTKLKHLVMNTGENWIGHNGRQ